MTFVFTTIVIKCWKPRTKAFHSGFCVTALEKFRFFSKLSYETKSGKENLGPRLNSWYCENKVKGTPCVVVLYTQTIQESGPWPSGGGCPRHSEITISSKIFNYL